MRQRATGEENYSGDKTEKLTGRVGSGSIRLRVNRLFFETIIVFK